ncbi:MAG: NAD(P)H-binding protein [Acidimicrobiia bacterium]
MDVVTGAFGYTGRFITQRLLVSASVVRTLTDHPDRPNPFGERVEVARLAFDDRPALVTSLRGVGVLYNTYWIRFSRGGVTFDRAVRNTRRLVEAAAEAGARRIVHLSITNPESSPLPYFTGKARAEQLVMESSLPYGIVRPTVLFGGGDVLINNIAWLLRRLPVFGVAGSGDYRIRPVHVDDVAAIAVAAGHLEDNLVVDAIGPETYTFEALVRLIAGTVGRRPVIVHVPPRVALALAKVLGLLVRDVLLTGDELAGLMAELVAPDGSATGKVRLSEWLAQHADEVGREYASELARNYR